MKAFGRTLWKVAEELNKLKREGPASLGSGPVLGYNQAKAEVVARVTKDRLAMHEERYAIHLEKAGVFEGGKAPKPITTRKSLLDVVKGKKGKKAPAKKKEKKKTQEEIDAEEKERLAKEKAKKEEEEEKKRELEEEEARKREA